jgi:N-acetylmuramidase/Putative peptidoglycan binding domain
MTLPFQGMAWALSKAGLDANAAQLGVSAAEIWTVLAVETSSCGFLPDRRPQILYERHVFHRLTQGRYDDGDISDPSPGGYGAPGAHQYERLSLAIARDRSAALQSTSWGIGQIIGYDFAAAAYSSVENMINAACQSEDEQLQATGNLLISMKAHTALRAHDWTSFARRYNGPDYVTNRYDVRLNAEYNKYSSGLLPNLDVRAAQLYLTYLGFHPGGIDGMCGKQTLSALSEFQVYMRLRARHVIDADTVEQLKSILLPIADAAAAQ